MRIIIRRAFKVSHLFSSDLGREGGHWAAAGRTGRRATLPVISMMALKQALKNEFDKSLKTLIARKGEVAKLKKREMASILAECYG